jgi:hypothetical protein
MTAGRKSPVSRTASSSGTVSPVSGRSRTAGNQTAAEDRIKGLEKSLLEARGQIQVLEKKAQAASGGNLDGKEQPNQVLLPKFECQEHTICKLKKC